MVEKYTEIKRIKFYGAPVYLHWSAILFGVVLIVLSIKSPLLGVISVVSYLAVIFLHEAGHAYLAHRLGYQVYGVYIGFMHGVCEYETPYSLKHEAIIAWGVVAAQLLVAIPLIVGAQIFEINQIFGVGPIVTFLGYISAMTVLVNLTPVYPLDGALAWKLVPIIIKEKVKNKPKSKTKKSHLKIIK